MVLRVVAERGSAGVLSISRQSTRIEVDPHEVLIFQDAGICVISKPAGAILRFRRRTFSGVHASSVFIARHMVCYTHPLLTTVFHLQ